MQSKQHSDYVSIVAHAEQAVESMKDPALKQIAFAKVLDNLLAGRTNGQAAPNHHGNGAGVMHSSGKQLSLVEFLEPVNPASNPQRIAAFAAYREQVEHIGNFSPEDLKVYFSRAKLPTPTEKYKRDFGMAVKEGWIYEAGSESYLTQKGQRAVAEGFGGKAKPRGRAVAAKRKKTKRVQV